MVTAVTGQTPEPPSGSSEWFLCLTDLHALVQVKGIGKHFSGNPSRRYPHVATAVRIFSARLELATFPPFSMYSLN